MMGFRNGINGIKILEKCSELLSKLNQVWRNWDLGMGFTRDLGMGFNRDKNPQNLTYSICSKMLGIIIALSLVLRYYSRKGPTIGF